MRKTLSLVLAVLMMVTLVAIPALADTNTPTDVSSIIKYYGVGSARTPWAAHATNGYNGVIYANMVNITNKNLGVEHGFDAWSKYSPTSTDASVTVETFEDSNVIKLAADATAAGGNPVNAGIGLNPVSGADLIAGATFTYNFRVYVPASDVALNFASVGVAKVEGDTLNYFLINQPVPTVTTTTEQSVSGANRSTDPGFQKPIGVAPLFYHEGTTVKTILTNRHNKDTGLYLGGTGFGDGTKNYAGGGSLVYEKWYNYTVTLGYKEDVGLTVSLGADDTAFPETTNSTTTLPLTADELSALSATDVSLVISATGNTQIAGANKYVYIKDVAEVDNGPYTVTFEGLGKGTLTTTSVEVEKGATLTAEPTFTSYDNNNFYIRGYKIGDTAYTWDQLKSLPINEDTTVTVLIKERTFSNGEYDFSAMTADALSVSPFSGWSSAFVQGKGIEMMNWPSRSLEANFIEDTANQGMEIEFTYTQSAGTVPFDATFQNSSSETIQNWYQQANSIVVKGNNDNAALENVNAGADGQEHTLKFIIDDTNNKMYVVKDGVIGATSNLDSYATLADGLIKKIAMTAKGRVNENDSFVIKKINITRYATMTAAPKLTVENGGVASVTGDRILTNEIYMPAGTKATLIADLSEGQNFTNWTGNVEPADAATTVFTMGDRDATVTANSALSKVTATFVVDSEKADYVGELVQEIDYGTAATAPTVTAKEGYTFTGWDVDPATAITENTTYTAQFTAVNKYTITFEVGENGTVTFGDEVVYVFEGNMPTPPTVVGKTGWEFIRWDKEIVAATGDVTYTAVYEQTISPILTTTADSGYYGELDAPVEGEAIFNVFFENYNEFVNVEKYGIFLYVSGMEENGKNLEAATADELVSSLGKFYGLVTGINDLDAIIIGKAFVVINGQTHYGALKSVAVDTAKWLGTK